MGSHSIKVQVDERDLEPLVSLPQTLQTKTRTKLRVTVYTCIFIAVTGVVYIGYLCPEHVCTHTAKSTLRSSWIMPVTENLGNEVPSQSYPINSKMLNSRLSYDDVSNENFKFDIKAHDVVVFLHIQKTGGSSFGRHLVRDLDLERPCTCHRGRKRCNCFRPSSDKNKKENWLFSRFSTGWKCGLHADWTELTSCVDSELDRKEGCSVKRRYFYITLLREPISRYLSEFRHVQRGATWKNSRHWCGGRVPTDHELPRCYSGEKWDGVTLDDFLSCEHNLANNRQTRMLADLALIGCYNRSYMGEEERNHVMLASAKRNLGSMAFFGLTEHQKISQYMFEETFNLKFAVPFEQRNVTFSSRTMPTLSPEQIEHIKSMNKLDIELYDFAKRLMDERFSKLKVKDKQFEERFKHLGYIFGSELNWDELEDES